MTAPIEDRLEDALRAGAGVTEPAPDLFERVAGSIADDRARRSRGVRSTAVVSCLVASVAAVVFAMSETRNGRLLMAWWVLEIITNVVLIGVALWLGPFIKRFGRAYAADVFRANPRTGKSYIVLTDIVYYLIFTAYILFTVRFEAEAAWQGLVDPEQVRLAVLRLAGILLVIGVLHGLNIILMPVLGRLFSLNRRLDASNVEEGVDE